jgi:hypothetical protein
MKEKRYYMNDEHNFVPQSKATILLVCEYNSKNEMVKEQWIDLKQGD